MSRRRTSNEPPRIIFTCTACDNGKLIAEIRWDSDGDPLLTARAGSVEYSRVEPFELDDSGRLVHVRTEMDRQYPRKVTIHCPAGHPARFLVTPWLDRLRGMRPGESERHAV